MSPDFGNLAQKDREKWFDFCMLDWDNQHTLTGIKRFGTVKLLAALWGWRGRMRQWWEVGWCLVKQSARLLVLPFLPMNCKLPLLGSITEPVEAHVYGFGSLLFDGVIDDAFSTGIVSLDGCGGLLVAKEFKCILNHACILSIVEKCSHFG